MQTQILYPVMRGISSMATRAVLADLVVAYGKRTGRSMAIESVGGVDAARRVQSGEAFDAVFLASDAIDKLVASGHVLQDSKVDLMRSGVAVAVRLGAAQPDISTEDALRDAVRRASSIGFSTGPSGVALARLFERWGIAQEIEARIVQAPPGVPVGTLVVDGRVALGFQQTSELMHLEGIAVLGPLPPSVQIVTTFSAGVCRACSEPEAVRALLAFMASSEATDAKRIHGMEPV
jgi:molybdate transport system substrate-binding protein